MKPDEDILAFLPKLNLELAGKESDGKSITPPGFNHGLRVNENSSPAGTAETPISRSAEFPVCRIADIPVGGASASSRHLESSRIRRPESLRNGRPGGLRHVPQGRLKSVGHVM